MATATVSLHWNGALLMHLIVFTIRSNSSSLSISRCRSQTLPHKVTVMRNTHGSLAMCQSFSQSLTSVLVYCPLFTNHSKLHANRNAHFKCWAIMCLKSVYECANHYGYSFECLAYISKHVAFHLIFRQWPQTCSLNLEFILTCLVNLNVHSLYTNRHTVFFVVLFGLFRFGDVREDKKITKKSSRLDKIEGGRR